MKIGIFFGAGAERGYGLPSGGKFAVDIFRQDASYHKQNLRNILRDGIDRHSLYATNWLPDKFESQRIHAFGKNEFSAIIESSMEYRKFEIINKLNQFDSEADLAMTQLGISSVILHERFKEATGTDFGSRLYSQVIRMNPMLAQEVSLFGSEFFSAILDIIRNNNDADLKRYASSFIQLLVGAHGHDLVQRLNQELFTEAPDDIPIFDDLSGMFKLELLRAGFTPLELILDEQREYLTGNNATISNLLCSISQRMLENIFSTVLDYQSLIDSHFRYLFTPKAEWAKFTKMVVFLNTTRDYIFRQLQGNEGLANDGYYHDLRLCINLNIEITTIGTANYNNLIEKISEQNDIHIPSVVHLNGGVNDYYNPYKNSIVTFEDADQVPKNEIYVPFILTQSGLKPLTSVDMSRRYVNLYDSFDESDAIVVVGYGFNVDDSHINGMFRDLVENRKKQIFWVCHSINDTSASMLRELQKKLRLSSVDVSLLHIILVDDNRNINNHKWIEEISLQMAND